MTPADRNSKRRKRPTAVVNSTGCTGCQICVAVCPTECITIKESDMNFNGVAEVNQEICNGCYFCAIDCPWGTISMINPDGSLADYSRSLRKARGYV